MANGTKPTQIRLTDRDRADIAAIQQHFGLPSLASAIRYAVGIVRLGIPRPMVAPRKKSPKKSG